MYAESNKKWDLNFVYLKRFFLFLVIYFYCLVQLYWFRTDWKERNWWRPLDDLGGPPKQQPHMSQRHDVGLGLYLAFCIKVNIQCIVLSLSFYMNTQNKYIVSAQLCCCFLLKNPDPILYNLMSLNHISWYSLIKSFRALFSFGPFGFKF